MQKRGAVVQVKRPLTMLLDKFHRSGGGPFRIVALKRCFGIVPINILGPREPEILHGLPIAFFIFKFFAIELRCVGDIFLNLMEPVLLSKLCITEGWPHMKFPHHTRGVPRLGQQRCHVLIIRLQLHVEARQALLALGKQFQKFRRVRRARITAGQKGVSRRRANRAGDVRVFKGDPLPR